MEYLERGIPMLERVGDQGEAANSMGILGLVHAFTGAFAKCAELVARVFRIAEAAGNATVESMGLTCKGLAENLRGNWKEAEAALTQAVAISRRTGNPIMQGLGVWGQGYAACMTGRAEEGISLMQKGIALIESTGSHLAISTYCGRLALACAESGRGEEAAALADKALELVSSGGDRLGEPMVLAARAVVAAQGDPPHRRDAGPAMQRALQLARERGTRPDLATLQLRYARLLQRAGDAAGAREHLEHARAAFAELGMDWWLAQAEALAAESGPGRRARRRSGGR